MRISNSCKECVARIAKEVGPVDILVNNAGITRDTTFKKMSKGDWDSVIRTNLDSVFNMTKQVMDGMVDRGWGRVVNVSSVNGSKGAFGQTNYSAAKAGMHGFTKALALEVARKGVTVNTISPGYIGTKMVMAIPTASFKQSGGSFVFAGSAGAQLPQAVSRSPSDKTVAIAALPRAIAAAIMSGNNILRI